MRYQLYELYGFHDGNDDILSDIGNVGANERHGMWALKPYDVSDGPGVINEDDIPPVEYDALDDKAYAIEIAQAVADKLNLGSINYLGYGGNGVAFEVNNKVVLKLTIDLGEADAAFIVLRNGAKYLAEIYNIYKVVDTETNRAVFAILEENIINKPTDKFLKMEDDINKISPEYGYQDLLSGIRIRKRFDYNEALKFAKTILTANPEANVSQADRKAAYEHLVGILNIRQELIDLGIKSTDYIAKANLGYSNGVLKFFDVGGHIEPEPSVGKNIITLPEDVEKPLKEDYSRQRADAVAAQIGKKLGIEPHYLAHGFFGVAYDIGDDKILKITSDNSEAAENLKLIGKPLKYIAQPYNVYKVESTSPDFPKTYAIILEKLKTDAPYFKRMYDRLDYAFKTFFDTNYKDVLEAYLYGHQFDHDIEKTEFEHYFKKNSEDADFFFSILRIAEELDKYGVETAEYYSEDNLGYKKSGAIALFDVGFGNGWLQPDNPDTIDVSVDEDGSAKFSTDNEFGQDGFPPYSQHDTSPLTKNDLDANTAMYGDENMDEDLKYNHVKGDATDDAYMLTENIESLKQQLAQAAQKVYDEWEQNEEGECDMYGVGGICHDIADAMCGVLTDNGYECTTVSQQVGEQHVYSIAKSDEGVFLVDIPPHSYETGGGYCWKKIPGVKFTEDYVVVDLLSHDPNDEEYNGYFTGEFLDEDRKKAWVPGSKAVTVKKNCRLGGKADGTSDACNQGDINNLEFTALTEDDSGSGVGDKYAEKRFGVKPEFGNFEDEFNKTKSAEENQVIYRHPTEDWQIIKNPRTLTYIGPDVRGVIDKEGNLFVEQQSQFIHKVMVDALNDKGFLNKDFYVALDEYIPTDYLTVQRDGSTNDILVGESNDAMQDDEQMHGDWRESLKVPEKEEVIPYFQKFLDAAKRRNPGINFINEHIAVYRRAKYIKEEVIREGDIMQLNDLPFKSDVENLGGKIYSVGGAVRDEFLGKESKDLDILITGIPMDRLEKLLSKYGEVNTVGKSFGVIKFIPKGASEEIDIAIPRTETATGAGGHKGFDVTSDHALPIEKDLERRDFTINAIGKDGEGNIVDPYGGQEDLKNKIIRVVNPVAFSDDPLRMLRAVQFASRFGFEIEPETMQLIKANAQRIQEIPSERILIEFDKIIRKGNIQKGVDLLRETGLFKNIFGFKLKGHEDWGNVKTMPEFLFLLTRLLPNPAEFYLNKFATEEAKKDKIYKQIKALDIGFKPHANMNAAIARSIAHNMFILAPESLNYQILPDDVKTAAQELLTGKYPKTVNELAVNGDDLVNLGLKGKQIGDMQKLLLIKVYANKIRNDHEELLSLAQQGLGNLNEDGMKRVSYSAVVLDDKSRATLIKVFHPMIPEGWKIYSHHMTIKMGPLEEGSEEQLDMVEENMITLDVVDYAIDELVMAVGVKGYTTKNAKPHVTIAVNTADGGKPFFSNKLTEWRPVGFPIELTGKVMEVE